MMKRTLFILLSMLVCLSPHATAQEAEKSGQEKAVYPKVLPDNRVSFTLAAPLARQVNIAGDFLPGDTAQAMTKDADGCWHYTTAEALPSEIYLYSFTVDGNNCLDPLNVHLNRDIDRLRNIFIVPGTPGDDYSVRDVPHGTVSKVWYHSASYGEDRRLSIYTPPGYETGKGRYPVLYLLHGTGGDEDSWCDSGRAVQILDNLTASGEITPMIVVMPNGNASLQAAPGQSSEGLIRPEAITGSLYESSYIHNFPEIVEYTDRAYRTIAKAEGRAIAGLSMGGAQAFKISAEYPELFGYVGLFSAAVKRPGYNPMEEPSTADMVKRQLGGKHAPLYLIAIGKDDFLYDDNKEYRAWLDARRYPYRYHESEGGHTWRNWRLYLRLFAPMLFK